MTFFEAVYDILKTIPKGKVTTYGDIAKALGCPRSSRVVGYALHVNPEPDLIPCYRVVNREGKVSESFAFGGGEVQRKLLEAEGVVFDENGVVDLKKYGIF